MDNPFDMDQQTNFSNPLYENLDGSTGPPSPDSGTGSEAPKSPPFVIEAISTSPEPSPSPSRVRAKGFFSRLHKGDGGGSKPTTPEKVEEPKTVGFRPTSKEVYKDTAALVEEDI